MRVILPLLAFANLRWARHEAERCLWHAAQSKAASERMRARIDKANSLADRAGLPRVSIA